MIRTQLARWIEESIALDGPYVHDTVLTLKSKITNPLEKQYETDLQQILATKKAQEEEERKKHSEESAPKEAEAAATTTATTSTTTNDQQQNETTTIIEPITTVPSSVDKTQHINDIVMTSSEQQRSLQVQFTSETIRDVSASLVLPRTDESSQIALQPEGTSKFL